MTPRQLHALEWAVDAAEKWRGLPEEILSPMRLADKVLLARAALAAAWAEYRAGQLAARTKQPRRALQRVPLGRGVDGGNAKG